MTDTITEPCDEAGSSDLATIAAFDMAEAPLRLERFPNGGWLVYQDASEAGRLGTRLGAYSSAREMLDALGCLTRHD